MYVYVYVNVILLSYSYTHTHIYIYVHFLYVCVYIYYYIHIHIYIYIVIYIYICIQKKKSKHISSYRHYLKIAGFDFDRQLAAGPGPRGSSDRCDPRVLARTPQVDGRTGDDCKDGDRKGKRVRKCWEHFGVMYIIRLQFS